MVGSVAPLWRNQTALLSEAGHKIGLYGHTRDFLDDLGPKKFRLDLIGGSSALEDVSGQKVVGFRAPYFSLTRKSLWALEILTEVGTALSRKASLISHVTAMAIAPPTAPFSVSVLVALGYW